MISDISTSFAETSNPHPRGGYSRGRGRGHRIAIPRGPPPPRLVVDRTRMCPVTVLVFVGSEWLHNLAEMFSTLVGDSQPLVATHKLQLILDSDPEETSKKRTRETRDANNLWSEKSVQSEPTEMRNEHCSVVPIRAWPDTRFSDIIASVIKLLPENHPFAMAAFTEKKKIRVDAASVIDPASLGLESYINPAVGTTPISLRPVGQVSFVRKRPPVDHARDVSLAAERVIGSVPLCGVPFLPGEAFVVYIDEAVLTLPAHS